MSDNFYASCNPSTLGDRRAVENTCLPVAERDPDGVLTYGRGLLQVGGTCALALLCCLDVAACTAWWPKAATGGRRLRHLRCHAAVLNPASCTLGSLCIVCLSRPQVDAAYKYLRRSAELDVPAGALDLACS